MRNLSFTKLTVVLCLLSFSLATGTSSYAAEVENLTRNGDFEEGLMEWDLRQSEGAVATLKEEKGEVFKGRACAFIEIDNVAGNAAWHLSLFQAGHELEIGETYTLAFWGKADKQRPVAIYVEQSAAPWDEYGRQIVDVGAEWQEYWSTFEAISGGPVWLRLALGNSDVDISIDNVRFYVGEYVKDEDMGEQKAVKPAGKLFMAWAEVKKGY